MLDKKGKAILEQCWILTIDIQIKEQDTRIEIAFKLYKAIIANSLRFICFFPMEDFHFRHSGQTILPDFFVPEVLDITVDNDIAV